MIKILNKQQSQIFKDIEQKESLIVSEIVNSKSGERFRIDDHGYNSSHPGMSINGFDFSIKMKNSKELKIRYIRNNNSFKDCPILLFQYDGLGVMECFDISQYEEHIEQLRKFKIVDAYMREDSRHDLEKMFLFFIDEINKYLDIIYMKEQQQQLVKDKKFDELINLI